MEVLCNPISADSSNGGNSSVLSSVGWLEKDTGGPKNISLYSCALSVAFDATETDKTQEVRNEAVFLSIGRRMH